MNLKDKYINFFKSKNHMVIPSAPVVPENDNTVLFNTAGMQPLTPYLKGQPHPLGKRLVDFQKCVRTNDLDEVGDTTHHTFFEMLGNWSLGDYFKKEAISWSFEFLTSVLNIPVERLAVTVFDGNDLVGRDTESAEIWKSLGIPDERISYLGVEDNWWPNMELLGPCGPDTEIFYWRSDEPVPKKHDPNDDRWVEIWNNVFMQYNHSESGFAPLEHKNVDTGMGVERVTAILEGVTDNYQSSIFKSYISLIEEYSGKPYDKDFKPSMRIIADHMRAVTIIIGENSGVKPSNTDQGYIVRRLIRRAIRHENKLGIDINGPFLSTLANMIIDDYKGYYPELETNREATLSIIEAEKNKFTRTLEKGLKEFSKVVERTEKVISGEVAFHLYDTYGFPLELTIELAKEKDLSVDESGFKEKFKAHQELSRAGAEGKFKSGLAGTGEIETKYHTATHLLNAALKVVLKDDKIHQMGSNITAERMRFDFNFDRKLTDTEKLEIENQINSWISSDLPVSKAEMNKMDAVESGAEAMFVEKYPDIVTVYTIGDVSKEICTGPHVQRTSELHHFKIVKEEASSAGVRRIKAILD
ncbi:MAG TPA: alanine--tRNA ligase [Firmicutes bacterium]|nr:alanine--tRNA ligase [Bacillota bacterium]